MIPAETGLLRARDVRIDRRQAVGLFLFLVLSVSLIPSTAISQSGGLGVALIIGERHAFVLEAPEAWALDAAGATSIGVGAAFRPESESWGDAHSVMYVNGIPKSSDSITVGHIIDADVSRARNRPAPTTVAEGESLGTIQGTDAAVRYFSRADSTLFEAVAYIDAPTVVILVVLSSRAVDDFRSSLDAFARLVDSYEWVTSDADQIARMRKHR